MGFRRGSDRSNRCRAVLLPLVVSRHPESEIKAYAELLLLAYRPQAPNPKEQRKSIIQFANFEASFPFLWESAKKDPQIPDFYHAHLLKSLFLQIVDVPFRNR